MFREFIINIISVASLITLLILAIIVFYWRGAMRAKEIATLVAKQWCNQHLFQLLDETVSMKKIALKRDEAGKISFSRCYQFEYTIENFDRNIGDLVLLGDQLISINQKKAPQKILRFK